MKKELVDVYTQVTNNAIVRMPERKFPGVVIQGDTLSIIFDGLMSALEKIEGQVDEDAFLSILEQAEAVESHLLHYEETLLKHGIELPYYRDFDRTTQKYEHHWGDDE